MSISIGLYPILDLWTVNKLQLKLQLQLTCPAAQTNSLQRCEFSEPVYFSKRSSDTVLFSCYAIFKIGTTQYEATFAEISCV